MQSFARRIATAASLLGFAVLADPAVAGSINVDYSIHTGLVVEPHTGSWSAVSSGAATLTLSALRATPGASTGLISGGTLHFLSLQGGPTHSSLGVSLWTVGSVAPAPGVAALLLPTLMGSFAGLNAAGTALASFAFDLSAATPMNALVGNHNPVLGPGSFTGMLGGFGNGGPAGGVVDFCFDAYAGLGLCVTGLSAAPVPSAMAAGSVPGFGVVGAEVSRSVALAPVPEPGTALLLGLGCAGLAAAARRER